MGATALVRVGGWIDCVDPVHRDAFLRWAIQRGSAVVPHLLPLQDIAASTDGLPSVRRSEREGVPIRAALAQIGVPTVGVAVTVTLPLVELLRTALAAGIDLGSVGPDDVLVDEAGAVIVVDRPQGAAPMQFDQGCGPGWRGVLLACRMVWERVDAREPCRTAVDAALALALGGEDGGDGGAAVDCDGTSDYDGDSDCRRALDALWAAIRAAGPPRPLRWTIPALVPGLDDALEVAESVGTPRRGRIGGVARALVERGIPLTRSRRIGLRRAVTVFIVAVAAVIGLAVVGGHDHPSDRASPVITDGARSPNPSATSPGSASTNGTRAEDATADPAGQSDREVSEDSGRPGTRATTTAADGTASATSAPPDAHAATTLALLAARETCLRPSEGTAWAMGSEVRACLDRTTAPGSPLRARDADQAEARPSMPTWTRGATRDAVDTLALVVVEDVSGTTTASALIERTEADWVLRDLVGVSGH